MVLKYQHLDSNVLIGNDDMINPVFAFNDQLSIRLCTSDIFDTDAIADFYFDWHNHNLLFDAQLMYSQSFNRQTYKRYLQWLEQNNLEIR